MNCVTNDFTFSKVSHKGLWGGGGAGPGKRYANHCKAKRGKTGGGVGGNKKSNIYIFRLKPKIIITINSITIILIYCGS